MNKCGCCIYFIICKKIWCIIQPQSIHEAIYRIDRFRTINAVFFPSLIENSQTRAMVYVTVTGKIEWVSSPLLKTIRAADAKIRTAALDSINSKLNIEDLLDFALRTIRLNPPPLIADGFNLQGENLTNEPGKKGRISLKARSTRVAWALRAVCKSSARSGGESWNDRYSLVAPCGLALPST